MKYRFNVPFDQEGSGKLSIELLVFDLLKAELIKGHRRLSCRRNSFDDCSSRLLSKAAIKDLVGRTARPQSLQRDMARILNANAALSRPDRGELGGRRRGVGSVSGLGFAAGGV